MESLDVLQRFRKLAADFRRAAEAGDLSAMGEILASRRGLIEELARQAPARTERERAERTGLLRSILELDREAERILEKSRTEIGEELAALDKGRRGLEGYAARGRPRSKRIDERG